MEPTTLETLRSDFEAAREAWSLWIDKETADFDFVSAKQERERWGEPLEAMTVRAADLFVIARDHGLNAAMLYKLSDGGIDPRSDPS